MRCKACEAGLEMDSLYPSLPIVGMVCHACYSRLSRPTRYSGCVGGESHVHLCERTAEEIERRVAKLRRDAITICTEQGVVR